ncbi:hypothetical protein [Desulfonema magnum]|uniref:ParB-like catalytic effector domain-containing protein n=1 Tax=Desulfonema magnum TaxID=45655 RepID=A0A975GKG8_9BACT|nr:hypothetical protein [Desulfonema magnum]QTA84734.1 Uncharacterized protein dnm_007340 [Desulfonema magnum]
MSSNTKKKVEIVKVKHLSEDELISRLRNVTMLQDESTRPYENAFISLENICIEDLFPPQRYVLKQELLKVRELKWRLEEHGIDLFQLNGFVRITLAGESEPIDLLPPVIEERIEKNGRVAHIINDGMHRIYTAYLEWVIPQVIFVRGLPKHLPYYAFPIPEKDWTKIELRDDIPAHFIKKWHRTERNKELYRNFNSAFMNVGGPRGNPEK